MSPETHRDAVRRSARRAWWLGVALAAGLLAAYLATGIYSVQPHEVGVLARFGRVRADRIPAGIHFAFPWPIDRVVTVPVRSVSRLSVDDFLESSQVGRMFQRRSGIGAYLLSGDNNIVTLDCVLQYSIQEPSDFLFRLADSELALRSLTANALIQTVAARPIDEVLLAGKAELQQALRQAVQAELDALGAGLEITFVELREVRPPETVQAAFHDVVNALIDKEKLESQALAYRSEQLPLASGRAAGLREQSEAYCDRVQTMARGDADAFLARLEQYRESPDLTCRQLRYEVLQAQLPRLRRACLIGNEKGGRLVRLVAPP